MSINLKAKIRPDYFRIVLASYFDALITTRICLSDFIAIYKLKFIIKNKLDKNN